MKTGYEETVKLLLEGGSLVASGRNGYRVRDAAHNVRLKVTSALFQDIKPVLRRKGGMFLINKNEVRRLHGNTLLKQWYKQQLQNKKPLPAESARA